MNNQASEGQAFITFTQAADMSRSAGLNNGRGIHPSTIRRWTYRGFTKGGFPIIKHPNLPGQIDSEQWAKFVCGSPATEYEVARTKLEIERRDDFLGGIG